MGKKIYLLKDIHLSIPVGHMVLLLGGSGAGKTTFLNAVTGYAEEFRDNGKVIQVTQGFWVSDSAEDYNEKYALSASAAMNAYNFDDLSHVTKIFNPDANLNGLCALAEACSYRAVRARRDNLANDK